MKKNKETGDIEEPVEEVGLECATEFQGSVIDKLSERRAEMIDLITIGDRVKMIFHVCTRALIGYRSEFMNDTGGTGVLNNLFHSYVPYKGAISRSIDKKGAIVAMSGGQTTNYAIEALQSRGIFFVGSGEQIYAGMVIGESSKDHDVDVNPCKAKALTNLRASGKDEKNTLTPPVIKSLEQQITEIRDDEMIEVTTKSIRLRKKILDVDVRRRKKAMKKKLTILED